MNEYYRWDNKGMKLNFEWHRKELAYQNGENLLINNFLVGYISYNSTMSRTDTDEFKKAHQYVGEILLPATLGRTYKTQYAPTPEECKKLVETIVTHWFEQALRSST